jgi:hypothetical protein
VGEGRELKRSAKDPYLRRHNTACPRVHSFPEGVGEGSGRREMKMSEEPKEGREGGRLTCTYLIPGLSLAYRNKMFWRHVWHSPSLSRKKWRSG